MAFVPSILGVGRQEMSNPAEGSSVLRSCRDERKRAPRITDDSRRLELARAVAAINIETRRFRPHRRKTYQMPGLASNTRCRKRIAGGVAFAKDASASPFRRHAGVAGANSESEHPSRAACGFAYLAAGV